MVAFFTVLSGLGGLLMLLLATFVIQLLRAPYKQRDEFSRGLQSANDKLTQLEAKELQVVVKSDDQNYVQTIGDRYKLKIGIRTKGKHTIHGVQVDLNAIDGNRTPQSNPQLFPSESQGIMSHCFDVNPSNDSDKFVDILTWDKGQEYAKLHYFKNYKLENEILKTPGLAFKQIAAMRSQYIPEPITAERHVLSLRVSGNDTNEIFQDIIMDKTDDGGLTLRLG